MKQKLFPLALVCLWLSLTHTPSFALAAPHITLREYPLPQGLVANQILFGPQKALWFTVQYKDIGLLGRSTTSGKITIFPLPFSIDGNYLATMNDGNLWFYNKKNTAIARFTPAGKVTLFPITNGSFTGGLSYNAGALWFLTSNHINAIVPSGRITTFALPPNVGGNQLTGGPDGNVWVTDPSTNSIVRVSPHGKVTLFPIPSSSLFYGSFYSSLPYAITSGPDGNLWFIEDLTHKLGRITPQGVITEFSVPSLSSCYAIVSGPDHHFWSPCGDDLLLRLSTTGHVTIFHPPTRKSSPYGITAGPDHSLWFTEFTHSALGQISSV